MVATPEKLDFALRQDGNVLNDVGLIVFDEGHMIGTFGSREIRYEVLIQRLLRRGAASPAAGSFVSRQCSILTIPISRILAIGSEAMRRENRSTSSGDRRASALQRWDSEHTEQHPHAFLPGWGEAVRSPIRRAVARKTP